MKIEQLELKNYVGIYNGLHLDHIKINYGDKLFTVLCGQNGSGKTTLTNAMTPFASVDKKDPIIPTKEGYKKIIFSNKKYKWKIVHNFTPNSNGGHNVKSFISRSKINADEEWEELNPNGNVTSFLETVEHEMDINIDSIQLLRLGNDMDGLIKKNATERKKYMSKFIADDISEYTRMYKAAMNNFKDVKKELNDVVKALSRYPQLDSLEFDAKITANAKIEKDKVIEALIAQKAVMENEYNSLSKEINPDDIEKLKTIQNTKTPITDLTEQDINRIKNMSIDDIRKNIDDIDKNIELNNLYSSRNAKDIDDIESEKMQCIYDIGDLQTNIKKYENQLNDVDGNNEIYETYHNYITKNKNIYDELKDTYKFSLNDLMNYFSIENTIYDEKSNLLTQLDLSENLNDYDSSKNYTIEYQHHIIALNKIVDEINKYSQFLNTNKNCELKEEMESKIPAKCIGHCNITKVFNYISKETQEKYFNIKADLNLKETVKKEIEKQLQQDQQFMLIQNYMKSITSKLEMVNADVKVLIGMNKFTYQYRLNDIINGSAISQIVTEEEKVALIANTQLCEQYAKTVDEFKTIALTFNNNKTILSNIASDKDRIVALKVRKDSIDKKLNNYKAREAEFIKTANELNSKSDEYNKMLEYKTLITAYDNIMKNKQMYDRYNELGNMIRKLSDELDDARDEMKKLSYKEKDIMMKIHDVREYNERKEKLDSRYTDLEYIKKSLSSTEGIPLQYVKKKFNKTKIFANRILQRSFGGEIQLLDFEIDDDFRIPCIGRGVGADDVSKCSAGERSMVSLAISLALAEQTLSKYNILELDELDGPLDRRLRQDFFHLIEDYCVKLGIDQVMCITHNDMISNYNTDLILLKNSEVDNYNDDDVIYQY